MVDIRSFFSSNESSKNSKKRPAAASKSSAEKDEKKAPAKVQKTAQQTTSKYFKSDPAGGTVKKEGNQMAVSPRKSPKKPSDVKPATSKPRRTAHKTNYVNLDSDFDDSEDAFEPDEDAEEEEDDVFEIEDEPESDAGRSEPDDDDIVCVQDDADTSVQEVEAPVRTPAKKPAAARATPKATPAKKTAQPAPNPAKNGAQNGVHADEILSTIADAELPEAPAAGEKLNYFALKSKQESLAPPSGHVQLPEAAENCLGGLTIVFTGVLPNLDRDASEAVAKQYGARVTKSISKKTSLVVVGEEAGPSKVKKIKDLGIKAIDEAGFIELLSRMPADGGSGENAQVAKRKREEEEQAILEQAMAEEKAEKEAEEARQAKRRKLEEEREAAEKEAAERAKHLDSASSGNNETNAKTAKNEKENIPRSLPELPKREIPASEKLWTVKYAPDNLSQICGNKGQVAKLRAWLEAWFSNAKTGFKNAGPDGSGVFRAALISGPPGIGKTTAAHLVARELGFDILEKNASDVRSKSLLNSEVKSVLNNTSVVGFFRHQNSEKHSKNERRFCLIMDEVDGMSSGDHGGAGALAAFCRTTQMPMVLICNDKSLPKMRPFDRVTYALPFRRPSELEMRARLLTIAHRERLKLEPAVIGQLAQATGNDIRQIINLMATVSRTQKVIGSANSAEIADSWKKHVMLKPFDIAASLLAGPSSVSLNDRLDLYFNDIDFAPLMVQENYLLTRPRGAASPLEHLKRVANAADSISESDRVNSLIRSSEQQWSLLPFHGVMSTVRPAHEINGALTGRINFSSWLGQNSRGNKNMRLLQELQYHARLRTSASKSDFRLDYVPVMRDALTAALVNDGEDGIERVIETMDQYYLTRDDWDSVLELGVGPAAAADILKRIPTKVKTAFTRKYNGMSHPVAIYKTGNSVGSGGGRQKVDYEDVVDDDTARDDDAEGEGDEESGEIDSKKDKLIKKLPAGKGGKAAKATKGKPAKGKVSKPAPKKKK